MIDSSSLDADQVTEQVLRTFVSEDKRNKLIGVSCMAERMNKGKAQRGRCSEFEAMFEESLRTVKPGVVKGRVVCITATMC